MSRNLRTPSTPHLPDHSGRGFTIIQLAICLAVLMFALAVLIPAMKRQMGLASSTRCRENLREIHQGLIAYRADHSWWPERQVRTQAGLIKDSNVWVDLILDDKYVSKASRFICPGDINAPRRDSAPQEFLHRQIADGPSYGLNQLIWREYGVAPSDDVGLSRKTGKPSETILLADMGPDIPDRELPKNEAEQRRIIERARDAGRLVPDDGFRFGAVRPPASWLTARHGRTINLIAQGGNAVAAGHDVSEMMDGVPADYYDDCATGTCTFCNVFRAPHYDFSESDLYWWTGPYYAVSDPPPAAQENEAP